MSAASRPVRDSGLCYGCGQQARRLPPDTPALLTVLREDADRAGLCKGDLVRVEGETERGRFELVALVSVVCDYAGDAEDD